MKPEELEQYLALTLEIERLEGALETAVKSKQGLAKTLYERYGSKASYKVGDEVLVVAPTKTGTYYFAPRVRWSKESRAAKAEKKRLDRIARMQRPPKGYAMVVASESAEEISLAAQLAEPPSAAELIEDGSLTVSAPEYCGTIPPRQYIPVTPRRIEITATLSRKSTPQIYSDPDEARRERMEDAYHASVDELADAEVVAAGHATASSTAPEGSFEDSWATLEDCQGESVADPASQLDSGLEVVLDSEGWASPMQAATQQDGSGAEPSVQALSPEAILARPTPVPPTVPPTTPPEMPDAHKLHLPIVGEVDKPVEIERRLLQIQEPQGQEPDDLDPFEELLRGLD